MTTSVVPYSGASGKTRVDLPPKVRRDLSLAMLADVVSAASEAGEVVVVTSDRDGAALARRLGAVQVSDPGGGQGQAVAIALAGLPDRPALVVNADLPCATPADVSELREAIPPAGLVIVEAMDGTTNALGLSSPRLFAPLYGPGSSSRFRALPVRTVTVAISNLASDVDSVEDLERLIGRCGPSTRACFVQFVSQRHLQTSN